VQLIPTGTHVVIPAHLGSDSDLRWITQPTPHRPLPPWSVVLDITRRVAAKLISEEPAVA
jgi:hypothetical protein